jgi:apolipoprotein N-acyltransferase
LSLPIYHHFVLQLVLAVASGALNVALFPKLSFVGLAWVFLAPLLMATHNERSMLRAFVLGWVCGAVFFAGSCYWIAAVLKNYGNLEWWLSALAFFLLVIYLASFCGLFTLLFARISIRRPISAFYLAPFLWVSIELARAHLLTGFPWCLAGYALVDKPGLAQISTITGVYGLSFIMVLANSLLVVVILFPSWKSTLKFAGMGLSIAAIGWLWTIPIVNPAALENRARIVQTNIQFDQDWGAESRLALLNELIHLSVSNPNTGENDRQSSFNLILWPETPTPFYFNHDPDFRYQLELVAKLANAYFLFGFVDFRNSNLSQTNGPPVNSVGVLSPSGEKISQYDKVHLVPFGEYVPYPKFFFFVDKISTEAGNFVPGRDIVVSKLENGHSLGAFICYEAIFPELVRQFARNGAELLVNVTNDAWFGESAAPSQHFNMARMRAVENRRYLLRAANDGISAIVSPYGEVLSKSKRFERTALEGRFETSKDLTLYTRFGDVFAWACTLLSAGFLLASFKS